ncbi:MAG: sterol desaturase family protein, partial [Candidatus Binatia bacterium]
GGDAMMTTNLVTIGGILTAMTVLAAIETVVPLHARGRWNRLHLGPNLSLTFVTFATNALFNAAIALALAAFDGIGLLHAFAAPPLVAVAAVVVALDFSSYVSHRAMHAHAALWRFHSVHHSDPAVDVTTAIRQHPGESVIRYAFLAAGALALGASPAAFAVYRAWSALHALLEHANVRMPRRLDSLLSLVVTTPNMHKVHHSRRMAETNTNYGNILSLYDRLFSTYTPSIRGVNVVYGLDGFDEPATQTTAGLLALPFRSADRSGGDAVVVRS